MPIKGSFMMGIVTQSYNKASGEGRSRIISLKSDSKIFRIYP
jgi:hypothetical protein